MALEPINSAHVVSIETSPKEADLAITSIDSEGHLGQLNEYVLIEYGYSPNDLPNAEQLRSAGFAAIPDIKGKPILFVVTIDAVRDTLITLEENLFRTLSEFREWFQGKKVWLPLMGTGSGGLTLVQSYNATARAINKFLNESPTTFFVILSLPSSDDGRNLRNILVHQLPTSSDSVDQFLSKLKSNFFLVGSLWDGDNQLQRFFEGSIWEKGHGDETYANIINSVNAGDIFIVKSTFQKDGISFLRIKGFGIVTEKSSDGASLDVEWRIKDVSIDVDNLGFYRNTITKAEINDVKKILSFLDPTLWERLLPARITKNSKPNSIPGLVSDSETGVDYLSITKDVTAFARVMAAKSFEPPLAIALFGKWGSGKSFFMRKLKTEILSLSSRNPYKAYCEGVVHIHFNAWSYMDANLWASIVSKIFEGLNEYISDNSISEEEKKNIERQLGETLTIAKEEVTILENQKISIEIQIETLEQRKVLLEKDLKKKIIKIEMTTVYSVIENVNKEFKVKEKISEALSENESLLEAKDKLDEIVPEKYRNDPNAAYQLAKSKFVFLRLFFNRSNATWNTITLVFILTIIFLVPYYLQTLTAFLRNADIIIPQAAFSFIAMTVAVWNRAEITYNKLQPLVSSFWKIKEDFDKKIEEAVSKYGQEEKVLKLEIEKNREELLVVDRQIQQALAKKADLEFRINNALATESLYSFIERRAKSEDYKKHLGIISIIRRDFEILNGLFTDHNTEAEKIAASEEFKKKFRKPLERIILYIDDLDRCPEENVVQVLEAVNLLMAFPLFIVIVGVDPRWVKNALLKRHQLQFTGKIHTNDSKIDGFEAIEPANYLEKIFQVPFHLKEAGKENVKEMIRRLAQTNPFISAENTFNAYIEEASNVTDDKNTSRNNIDSKIDILATSDPSIMQDDKHKPAGIEISDKEVQLLEDMGEIIGSNPRAIKRYLNSYRVVKAHEDFSYNSASEQSELLVIMFLLALPISDYRKLLTSFEEFIEQNGNQDKALAVYLKSSHDLNGLNDLKHKLDIILSDKSSYQILQKEKARAFLKHNEFIKRFTFKSL